MFATLRDLYLESIEKFADSTASGMLNFETLTYRDFDQRVKQVQDILATAGLEKGDKIAILSNNMPNWGISYFAIVISGFTVVPILPDFSGEEVGKILDHAEAKALIVSDKLFSKLNKADTEKLNIVIRSKNLGILSQKVNSPSVFSEPKSDDLAAIIYTSGTTSSPKGVMHTHRTLCAQLDMIYGLFPMYPEDDLLSILPLSHTYECSLGMLFPFMCGCSVYYIDKAPTAAVLMPAFKKVKPTVMLVVPLIIEKVYRSQIAAKFNKNALLRGIYKFAPTRKLLHKIAAKKLYKTFGGRLRFFGIGGSKTDFDTERFLNEGKFPYAIGYGLTETAPLIAGALPGLTKLGSTGPHMKEIEWKLDNINPETGEGELMVKTPSIMTGYYKNPEATAEAITEDGWFHTKDLCKLDKHNYLFIKGRLSNMIVGPSGENIYPEEIENVINSHFLVTESIVTEEKGKLVALVHFNYEALEQKYYDMKENLSYRMDDIKSDLMKYVNSKVNKFSKISTVEEQKEEFEKTPTQKIKRFKYNK
ncbi:MAG: AMP-binding protein [Rikenellaceae bacterium]